MHYYHTEYGIHCTLSIINVDLLFYLLSMFNLSGMIRNGAFEGGQINLTTFQGFRNPVKPSQELPWN